MAINVVGLHKRIGGREVLRDITFSVGAGQIYGLVGPNGAGKTTTLRAVVGLVRPDGGKVEVLGVDVTDRRFDHVRRDVAYLPEEVMPYDNLTGREFVEFIHGLYGRDNVEEALEISGLGGRAGDKVKTYSRGMKRRLLVATLLALRTRVLVLDEPTAGVDVSHAVALREAIRSHVEAYRVAVLLSSHNMLEVGYLCDSVGMVSDGRIIVEGAPSDLEARFGARNLEEAFVKALRWA